MKIQFNTVQSKSALEVWNYLNLQISFNSYSIVETLNLILPNLGYLNSLTFDHFCDWLFKGIEMFPRIG